MSKCLQLCSDTTHYSTWVLTIFDVIAVVYKGEDHMETYYLFINYLPLIYCFFINRPRVTVNVTVDTLVNHVLFPLILMRTPTNGSRFHQHLPFSVLGLLIQSYTLRRVIFYLPLEVCTFSNFKKIATWTLDGGGEGEHSLIWPRWVCAAEQVVVFRILTLEQGFHHLASWLCRVSFWTRRRWRLVISSLLVHV